MNAELIEAINALEKEKRIPREVLFETIESALVSAYKRAYEDGKLQNIIVNIDHETGDVSVYVRMDVVDVLEDEMTQFTVEEAKEFNPNYEAGDHIDFLQQQPKDFGRIAAQTAKQVVVQRIREAERDMLYNDYIQRKGEIITGTVHRISNDTVFITLGPTAEGMLTAKEQVPGERYKVGQRIKVYLLDIRKTGKGAQILLSRSHPNLVRKLFELEVPEIAEGTVRIVSLAREAGSRTKMAVTTEFEDVDPIGSCVGPKGNRVQAVCDELNGEKIDIIQWSENPEELIANVLSPAKVEQVFVLDEENGIAQAVVPDYQLSLAIGKEGQNVRLAANVSNWKIDIKSHTQYYGDSEETEA